MRLSMEISETQQRRLSLLAERLNVPAEDLAVAALDDLLDRREAAFETAAQHVIDKNSELYRRLA